MIAVSNFHKNEDVMTFPESHNQNVQSAFSKREPIYLGDTSTWHVDAAGLLLTWSPPIF